MRDIIQQHKSVLWTFVGVALVLVVVIGSGKDRVPASELRVLLPGNTLSGRTDRGSSYHVYYRADGTMSGFAHSRHYDLGTWEITGNDRLCRQWNVWRYGKKACFEIYRLGDDQFRMISSHPRYEATFLVRKGDPEGLKDRIGMDSSAGSNGSSPTVSAEDMP